MGFLSRRRGRRLRVIALVCLAVFAASAFTPSPLAHAPPFRRAFGQQTLAGPGGVATDPFGDVRVADQGNSRVEEFSAIGGYRTSFAVPAPAGIRLDVHGDVWVSSPAFAPGNSVQEFSPAGLRLGSFGTTQAGYGDLGDPGGIAIGPAGRIYVAQPDYGLVSVFSPGGRFLHRIRPAARHRPGGPGPGPSPAVLGETYLSHRRARLDRYLRGGLRLSVRGDWPPSM